METKQIKHINRIIFLQRFTEEIIKNLSKGHHIERKIRIEKLKQKFGLRPSISAQETISAQDAFKKILNHKILESPRYERSANQAIEQNIIDKREKVIPQKPILKPAPQKFSPIPNTRKTIFMERHSQKEQAKQGKIYPLKVSEPQLINPEYASKRPGFTLGKVDELLKDPFIQTIECIGPGKNILIKGYNKINLTKIILTQEEINNIISIFSKESKIPLVGGILKAAVGDLIISAIISEQAGSRFIISKIDIIQTI